MDELLAFYLHMAAAQTLPLFLFTLLIICATSLPILKDVLGIRIYRVLRRFGIPRLEQLFNDVDSEFKNDFIMLSIVICVIELMIMAFVTLAIVCPYDEDINEEQLTDVMYDLVTFSTTTSIMHLIPMGFLVLALVFDVLPTFMPTPPGTPTSLRTRFLDGELQCREIDSIRFIRFENAQRIIISAISPSGTLSFGRRNEPDATTISIFHDSSNQVIHTVHPPLYTINELDEILFSNE